ncbi:MAG: DUF4082 domain-containing protein [Pseudomonadota bacterium]
MSITKTIYWVAGTCLALSFAVTPIAAQEDLGISTGPGPTTPTLIDGGGPPFPAIDSFTGGTAFGNFYADSTGDVVGFRFTMNSEQAVQSLGVWNGDTAGAGGLDNPHQVGIWDDTETLIASTTVTPTSTAIGDFRYEDISPVTLSTGVTYTIGVVYTATDDDSYVSGPTITFNSEVTSVNAVFPSAGDLGFVFPTEDSGGNAGRLGPNFLFGPPMAPLPETQPVPTLSILGILLLLLVIGAVGTIMLRRRHA